MKRNRYGLSKEAQGDLRAIRAYYLEKSSASVAHYVMREITRAFGFLAATPGVGHIRADLTSEPVKFWPVFSYLIVYNPLMKPLGVARVVHSSQDLAAMFHKNPPRG